MLLFARRGAESKWVLVALFLEGMVEFLMKKETFGIQSSDKKHILHVITWTPDGEIRAAIQLVHGMVEFIDRYHDFAAYLCSQGIAVIGHDHLGHGLTAGHDDDLPDDRPDLIPVLLPVSIADDR